MNSIKIFENKEFGEIRTIMVDGVPWFAGKDVAIALDYKDAADALKRHVDAEDKLTRCFTDSGQRRNLIIINESGLYALVFGSRLETAKKFKRWVTSEVLPAIRQTGTYIIPGHMPLAEHPGEVANYLREMDRVMRGQGTVPYKIAEAFLMVSTQYGIQLPADFVKVPQYEQMEMAQFLDMKGE